MEQNPYCYPDTDVLINKLDIRTKSALEKDERVLTAARMGTLGNSQPISPAGLRSMHRHMFEQVYEWAGNFRTVTTHRGPVPFCRAEYIEAEINKRFAKIKAEGNLKGLDPSRFSERAAEHINEINAIHPFLEGNGRTQRAFLETLAYQAGHPIDLGAIQPKAWNLASIDGFYRSDNEPMTRIIADALIRERGGRVIDGPDPQVAPISQGGTTSEAPAKEDGDPKDQTKAFRLMVTKSELEAAIAIRNGTKRKDSPNPDPIVRMLAYGGDSIAYLAYRKSGNASIPDRWLRGTKALDALRHGFGGGRYRSLKVEVTTDGMATNLAKMADHALKAATGRNISMPGKRPSPSAYRRSAGADADIGL